MDKAIKAAMPLAGKGAKVTVKTKLKIKPAKAASMSKGR